MIFWLLKFFSRIGTREEVVSLLHLFVSSIQKEIDPQEVCFQIIQKLKNIRDIANQSIFFKNYKVKIFTNWFNREGTSNVQIIYFLGKSTMLKCKTVQIETSR